MADLVANKKTSLGAEDAIVRAVQFFSTERWRATSQSARAVTFQGKPPVPWLMLILTFVGFLFCIVPGVILYIMVLRKLYRFQNLVVTASSSGGGSEVSITYPNYSEKLVKRFIEALPAITG